MYHVRSCFPLPETYLSLAKEEAFARGRNEIRLPKNIDEFSPGPSVLLSVKEFRQLAGSEGGTLWVHVGGIFGSSEATAEST